MTSPSDKPDTDRHDRHALLAKRVDAIEHQLREGLSTVADLRRALVGLEESRDEQSVAVQGLQRDIYAVRAGQDSIARDVGEMRAQWSGLRGEVAALAKRVPSGTAVAVAGIGAGGPSLAVLIWHVAQSLLAR
jgi:hypothetical protein